MSNNEKAKKRFYRIVIPLGLGSGFSMLGDSTVYTVLPLYIEAAGITLAGAGILMGINRLVRLFSNTVTGILLDYGNKRAIFVCSLFLGAFSTLFFAFFNGFWPLFTARIIWGVAWSGISIGGTSILLAEADKDKRGKWIGIHQLWILAGNIFGSFMGGILSDLIGYRGAMAVNGAISLFSAIGVFLFLPETETKAGKKPLRSFLKNSTSVCFGKKLYLAAAVLFITRLIFSGFLVAFLSIITREKIFPFIAFFGLSTLTGIIGSSKSVVSMIAAPGAGFMSDKFNSRWNVVSLSIFAGTFGLLMITAENYLIVISGLLLCALPASSLNVLIRTLAGDLAGKERQGMAVSFVLTAGDMGSAIGPPLAFFLYRYFAIDIIIFALSVLLLFSGFLVVNLTKTKKEKI